MYHSLGMVRVCRFYSFIALLNLIVIYKLGVSIAFYSSRATSKM